MAGGTKRGGRDDREAKVRTAPAAAMDADGGGVPDYEDPYEDEYEDEEDGDGGMEDEDDETHVFSADAAGQEDVMKLIAEDEARDRGAKLVWDPRQRCPDGDELECDPRAYKALHRLRGEWPCLSLDFIADDGGGGRTRFPHQLLAVTGTQADDAGKNRLTLMWLEGLGRMERDDSDSDSDESEDDDDDHRAGEPIMEHASFAHPGCVNRVASSTVDPGIVASWSDDGSVRVWDARPEVRKFCATGGPRPAGMISRGASAALKHADEGYALKWSKLEAGLLATGDNSGAVSVWRVDAGAQTSSRVAHYAGAHKNASCEDIAMSPTERTVLMSAGSDGALHVFDTRAQKPMLSVPHAHDADVNALAWNGAVSYLVATGGDDGSARVWDLRAFGAQAKPVGRFDWHGAKAPICAIDWDPHDESSLAVAAADDTVTLWDFSVEDAAHASAQAAAETPGAAAAADLPPQLLFVHQGLREPKDVKYHPQIPNLLMTTAVDGFNIFIAAL